MRPKFDDDIRGLLHDLPSGMSDFNYDDNGFDVPEDNSFDVDTHYNFEGLDDCLDNPSNKIRFRIDDKV